MMHLMQLLVSHINQSLRPYLCVQGLPQSREGIKKTENPLFIPLLLLLMPFPTEALSLLGPSQGLSLSWPGFMTVR